MGLMSKEYSSGSIKLLYSSPITNTQIILGKYASMLVYSAVLMLVLLVFLFLGAGFMKCRLLTLKTKHTHIFYSLLFSQFTQLRYKYFFTDIKNMLLYNLLILYFIEWFAYDSINIQGKLKLKYLTENSLKVATSLNF